MTKLNKALFCALIGTSFLVAQENFTFPAYNGLPINLTATSSTVNDDITITFSDSDLVNNFYTEGQSNIFLFGGLDTDAGAYQGAPALNDLSSQPTLYLTASDTDSNSAPNTYTITINLAQHYKNVANGITVYGFNLSFQNQLGGGGNNQTVDLFIDLIDASKDSTLSLSENNKTQNIIYNNGEVVILNYFGEFTITQFDVLGRKVKVLNGVSDNERYTVPLNFAKRQLILLKFETPEFNKTLKIISL